MEIDISLIFVFFVVLIMLLTLITLTIHNYVKEEDKDDSFKLHNDQQSINEVVEIKVSTPFNQTKIKRLEAKLLPLDNH